MSNVKNPLTRAELVAEYNHMATALGFKKVKDFKSKAIAEERIRRITPDYKLAVDDMTPRERADESNAQPNGDAVQATTELLSDVQAGVFQPRDPATLKATQDDAPVDNSGKRYRVVMHNNPNTAYWDVTAMLEGAFGCNFENAEQLMYECDDEGTSVIRRDLTEATARELLDRVETKRAEMIEAAPTKRDPARSAYIKDLVFTMEEQQ